MKDNERDEHLKELDIRVLRFENKDVLNNLTTVLQQIKSNFKT
jgi:very-short-patch-repair endonuclease